MEIQKPFDMSDGLGEFNLSNPLFWTNPLNRDQCDETSEIYLSMTK